MSDVSWKRTGELVHALFKVLKEHGDEGMPAGAAIAEVAKRVTLTEYESGFYTDGSRRYDKILRFGTISPVKAGWLVKDEGRWFVTEEGLAAAAKYKDPLEFTKRAEELYKAWKLGQPSKPEADSRRKRKSKAHQSSRSRPRRSRPAFRSNST